MASKRMFSITVMNSARFLKMPSSARLLYYDLGLRADDDGVVEAYTVMKATGCSEDDLRVLAAKGFVKILNEDLVTLILDWNTHNLIRPDRKIDSVYKNLILQVVPEHVLIEPKPRADTGKPAGRTGQAMDGQWTAQVRLGKVRLGKDRLVIPSISEVREYCDEKGIKDIDPEHFHAYYEARGWKYKTGQPMVSWKAAITTWRKNNGTTKKTDRADRKKELEAIIDGKC